MKLSHIFATLALVVAGSALAAGDHDHHKPAHGGIVVGGKAVHGGRPCGRTAAIPVITGSHCGGEDPWPRWRSHFRSGYGLREKVTMVFGVAVVGALFCGQLH